jgi:hypothetical protein
MTGSRAWAGQLSTSTSNRTAILPSSFRVARKRNVAPVIFRCLRRSTEAAVCSRAFGLSEAVERTSTTTSVSLSSANRSSSPAGSDTFAARTRYPSLRRNRAADRSLRRPNHRRHHGQCVKPGSGIGSVGSGAAGMALTSSWQPRLPSWPSSSEPTCSCRPRQWPWRQPPERPSLRLRPRPSGRHRSLSAASHRRGSW